MADLWHLARGKTKYGPYPWAQIVQMAATGNLIPTDMLVREGEPRWQMARDIPGLFPMKAPPPMPPPAPLPAATPMPSATPIAAALPMGTAIPLPAAAPAPAATPAPMALAQPLPIPLQETPPPATPVPAKDPIVDVASAGGDFFSKIKHSVSSVAPPGAPASATPPEPTLPPLPEGALSAVDACYQGGHPSYLNVATGRLCLTNLGLEFQTTVAAHGWSVPWKSLVDLMEPRQGAWPEAMVQKSQAMRTAAGMVHEAAKLGPPPNNRLIAVVLHQGAKYAVKLDVLGLTKEMMEEQAQKVWNHAASVRSQFATPTASKATTAPAVGAASILPAGGGAVPAGKNLYRVVHQGQVLGSFSAAEIAAALAAGQLAPTDMIAMETWVPVAALAPLLAAGLPVGPAGLSPPHAVVATGPTGSAGTHGALPLATSGQVGAARTGSNKLGMAAAGMAGLAAGGLLGAAFTQGNRRSGSTLGPGLAARRRVRRGDQAEEDNPEDVENEEPQEEDAELQEEDAAAEDQLADDEAAPEEATEELVDPGAEHELSEDVVGLEDDQEDIVGLDDGDLDGDDDIPGLDDVDAGDGDFGMGGDDGGGFGDFGGGDE